MVHFLFPSDPIDPKLADEVFREQAVEMQKRGFGVSLVSIDELNEGSSRIRGRIPGGASVVYRGWMLSPSEYDQLLSLVRSGQGVPLTSKEMYLACHYLPNWYPLVSEFTAETKVFPTDADLPKCLASLSWEKFFIKDYVKSLKTSVGSVVSKPEDVSRVLVEMEKFRGTIEGGICVRRFEEFVPNSEQRFFVIRGRPHSMSRDVPDLVLACVRKIASPFFSIDVAIRTDGIPRVVEIGDGQVSDLVGWNESRFADLWVG